MRNYEFSVNYIFDIKKQFFQRENIVSKLFYNNSSDIYDTDLDLFLLIMLYYINRTTSNLVKVLCSHLTFTSHQYTSVKRELTKIEWSQRVAITEK